MGSGPLRLAEAETLGRLGAIAQTSVDPIELTDPFLTEIGSAFDLHRAIAASLHHACESAALPLVLSGNCNASLGTTAGLQRAGLGQGLVVWFDGHGDSDTPDTFTGTFRTPWGCTLTGLWGQGSTPTVPGFDPISTKRYYCREAWGGFRHARRAGSFRDRMDAAVLLRGMAPRRSIRRWSGWPPKS